MEPTHLRNRDDPSSAWRLDRPGLRAVLRQCQMRPAPVIVVDEVLKMSIQAALAENHHVIPGTPGAWCRSPVRHRHAARATAAQKALVGCPWPSPGRRNPSRRSDRGPVADSAAQYPRETLPAVVEQSPQQSDGPSPRNVRSAGAHAPAPETRTCRFLPITLP